MQSEPKIKEALIPEISLDMAKMRFHEKSYKEREEQHKFATELWRKSRFNGEPLPDPYTPEGAEYLKKLYPNELKDYYYDSGFYESSSKSYRGTSAQMGLPYTELKKLENRGVPQGAPLSPILAILGLENFLMNQISVQYADDGLIAAHTPFGRNEPGEPPLRIDGPNKM